MRRFLVLVTLVACSSSSQLSPEEGSGGGDASMNGGGGSSADGGTAAAAGGRAETGGDASGGDAVGGRGEAGAPIVPGGAAGAAAGGAGAVGGSGGLGGGGAGGGGGDAGGGSGGGAPGRCEPSAAFGAPEAVTELNLGGINQFPRISDDEQSIIFDRFPDYFSPLKTFVASRSGPGGPFSTAEQMVVEGRDFTHAASLALGGELVVFSVFTDEYDVWLATRNAAGTKYIDAAAIPALSDEALREVQAFVTPDGEAIWLTIGGNLFESMRVGSVYTAPTQVAGVNSPFEEGGPFLTPDALTLYFHSTRGGNDDPDIYRSTRASTNAAWSAPEAVTALNSATDELMGSVTSDDCIAYFSRGGAIYRARRPAP